MEALNERIKTLRKEKGLTQSQLADELGVTDKAVSKWEVGEANPDITLLAKLAEIFGVTIDYLLTGKVEETISLDDMDDEKRALYLIKKDDASAFEKYGYTSHMMLFAQPYYGRTDRRTEKLFEAICENNAKKIFKLCLKKSLENNDAKRAVEAAFAQAVRIDLDKYIRLCAESDCVEGLKVINLKYFAIGNKTSNDAVRFHIREGNGPADQGYWTASLSKETLEYIFSLKESKNVLDYMSEVEFFRDKGNVVYLMTNPVLLQLYKNKYFDRLSNALVEMEKYNEFAKEIWNESLRGSWYTSRSIQNGAIYFHNNAHGDAAYLRALVTPVNEAFTLAIENKDFEWIKKFNQYNRKLNEAIPEAKAYTLKDDKIKVMELEADKNTPLEDLLSLKHIYFGVLNLYGFLSDDFGLKGTEELDRLKEKIQRVKQFKPFIKSHFISPYELLMTLANSKNGKELFKFATDLQYKELENAVIDGNKELIKTLASDLFLPSEGVIRTFLREKENTKNIHVSGGSDEAEATELARKREISEARGRANTKFFEEKTRKYGRHLNEEMYKSLLNLQVGNIPLDDCYNPLTLEYIQRVKESVCDEYIEKLEDIIERMTNRKALEKEYNRISSELTREYLLSELDRGEADKVVVLICKRLQIILEHKFGYSGDLFTMIDTLIDRTMQLHNCTDDEDNSYNAYMEEDRLFTKRIQLLHKLRMKRNNIVHAERKEVEMSIEEIRECIDLIELLSK